MDDHPVVGDVENSNTEIIDISTPSDHGLQFSKMFAS